MNSLFDTMILEGQDAHKLGSPKSTIFPPTFFIKDVEIAAQNGYLDGLKWYDFEFTAGKINLGLNPFKQGEVPKVTGMENASFKGKIPYEGLAALLEKQNPSWTSIKMGKLADGGNTIYIYAKQSASDVSINVQGKLSVDKDGIIKFNPSNSKYYESNGEINNKTWNEALRGFQIIWTFTIMGKNMPVNRAAVSESGIYIEAGDLNPQSNTN